MLYIQYNTQPMVSFLVHLCYFIFLYTFKDENEEHIDEEYTEDGKEAGGGKGSAMSFVLV